MPRCRLVAAAAAPAVGVHAGSRRMTLEMAANHVAGGTLASPAGRECSARPCFWRCFCASFSRSSRVTCSTIRWVGPTKSARCAGYGASCGALSLSCAKGMKFALISSTAPPARRRAAFSRSSPGVAAHRFVCHRAAGRHCLRDISQSRTIGLSRYPTGLPLFDLCLVFGRRHRSLRGAHLARHSRPSSRYRNRQRICAVISPVCDSVSIAILALGLLGLPIGYSMIAGSILYLLLANLDLGTSAEQILNGLYNSYVLLAVPLFLFSAELMNVSKMTDHLLRFCDMLVGRFRGRSGSHQHRPKHHLRRHVRLGDCRPGGDRPHQHRHDDPQ